MFEKKFLNCFWCRVRARYGLSLVLNMFKFFVGFQLFDMKITSNGKPDLNNSFPRSDLRCVEVQGLDGTASPSLAASSSSLVYKLSLVYSKFTFSAGIQLFRI